MKKLLSLIVAATAVLFFSCSKEVVKEGPADTSFTGKTITFNASIEMPVKTRAALIGLDIYWQEEDYIGVATDNSAEIQVCKITVDDTDERKCSFTVNEVAGATAYYALFKGRLGHSGGEHEVAADNFSMITFDTTTKTFSGLTVGNQQVATGSFASYLWYSSGYPLAMAGKSNGNSIVMKPCLALVKLKIHEDSVPDNYYFADNYTSTKNILHEHNYSAVRGFNLYQKGSSTIYSSGDFDVQIAADGSLTTSPTVGGTRMEYRQCSQSAKLSSEVDYLMCLIPGGQITSFLIDFLGYSGNSQSNYSWDAVYSMSKSGSMTVKPGDYYDLGTLNPIGRKKAQNEAADEEEDSFTPVITINGSMTDWDPSSNSLLTNSNFASATGNNKFKELKVAYDKMYIYLYVKRNRDDAIWGSKKAYYYFFFDTDNNHTNGVEKDGSYYDYGFFLYPFAGTAATNETAAIPGFNPTPSTEVASGFTLGGGISTTSAGTYNDTDVEIEIRFLRNSLGIEKNDVINIAGYGNKSADSKPYTKIVDLTIVN